MAQGRMPKASSGAGASERVDHQGRAVPVQEAAASAAGGIGLVLLAKPLPSGLGNYQPFAVVRLQDLPEQLRRQIAGDGGRGAAAGTSVLEVTAAAPMAGQGAALHPQLLHAAHPAAGEGFSRQIAGVVSRPKDDPAVKFIGDGESDAVDNSERRILQGFKWVYLDASRLQVLDGKRHGHFEMAEGFSHAWTEHSGGNGWFHGPEYKVADENSESSNAAFRRAADAEMGALYDNGLPAPENAVRIAALGLHKNNTAGAEMGGFYDSGPPAPENAVRIAALLLDTSLSAQPGALAYSNGLVPPREDAVPLLLGSNRARAAEEALHDSRSHAYAVQVSVDAGAGAKAGDMIAVNVKAAGAGAGHEHGNLSAVVGIVLANSAATTLAAGAVGPVTAFGLFAVLVGGLSLAMASIRAL